MFRILGAHGGRYVVIGDLMARAARLELRGGITTYVAALEDIIRSKEVANREKDRLALPTRRLLLQKIREGQPPPVE